MSWTTYNSKQRKYLKATDRLNKTCEYLYAYNNDLTEKSGIYIFTRLSQPTKDGSTSKYIYIGQAKKVIERIAQHMIQFSQRIDISLKNRGLWYPSNPYGWKINVKYCEESELDNLERQTIANAIEKGYILYNITSGGQGEGKTDINERAQSKTYRDGLKQGYNNCLNEIREYFDKYLDFKINSHKDCFKKDGTYKEIFIKKHREFMFLMEKDFDE